MFPYADFLNLMTLPERVVFSITLFTPLYFILQFTGKEFHDISAISGIKSIVSRYTDDSFINNHKYKHK